MRSVHDADETKFEWVDTSGKDIERVGSVIHEIDLGEDTDGAAAQGVDMAGEFEGLRVDNIDICRGNGENNTVRLCDILRNQVACLFLDICGLIADGYLATRDDELAWFKSVTAHVKVAHLGQTWQIDESQVEDIWRVDFEIDGLSVDALVRSCHTRGLVLDLTLDIGEVCELSAGDMVEFCPF